MLKVNGLIQTIYVRKRLCSLVGYGLFIIVELSDTAEDVFNFEIKIVLIACHLISFFKHFLGNMLIIQFKLLFLVISLRNKVQKLLTFQRWLWLNYRLHPFNKELFDEILGQFILYLILKILFSLFLFIKLFILGGDGISFNRLRKLLPLSN